MLRRGHDNCLPLTAFKLASVQASGLFGVQDWRPISGPRTRETADRVVVYDLMRAAASQLIAQFTAGPADVPPSAEASAAIRAIRAQVAAVEPADTETQRKLTAQLRACLDAWE